MNFYTGFSSNLQNRYSEHLGGRVRGTRKQRPLKLVCFIGFKIKLKALQFEKYLKTPSGFAFRNKRLI